MGGYEQYGRLKEPRRHKDREPKREDEAVGFFESFNNKECEVCLTTGDKLSGVLKTDTYNKYDVLLETGEARFLIRKDSVLFVKASLNRTEAI